MKHYGAVDDPKDITTKEYVDAADNALKVKVDALWDFVCTDITSNPFQIVALRKESVDRNSLMSSVFWFFMGSLSARRAWIEITTASSAFMPKIRRSPQGERG